MEFHTNAFELEVDKFYSADTIFQLTDERSVGLNTSRKSRTNVSPYLLGALVTPRV